MSTAIDTFTTRSKVSFQHPATPMRKVLIDGLDCLNSPAQRYRKKKSQIGPYWHLHIPQLSDDLSQIYGLSLAGPAPGGTQIWFGQGCATAASKRLPIFKGHFGRKGYPFLGIFLEK